ncbi:MAG: hypothetical protein KF690_02125, partial [Bacteroidetes bacterium]|nr:hypothetical protein [Bacteroidota bacterium]
MVAAVGYPGQSLAKKLPPVVSSVLSGQAIHVGAQLNNPGIGALSGYDSLHSNAYVRLYIRAHPGVYVQDAFTQKIRVQVIPDGNVGLAQEIDLKVTFDPAGVGETRDEDVFRVPGARSIAIVVLDDYGQTPAANVGLDIRIDDIEGFKETGKVIAIPLVGMYVTDVSVVLDTINDRIVFHWDTLADPADLVGLESYELEWIYVNDHAFEQDEDSAFVLDEQGKHIAEARFPSDETPYSFRNNASRVRLEGKVFEMPGLYERGYIIARVRRLCKLQAGDYRWYKYLPWSSADTGRVSLSASHVLHVPGHLPEVNW